MTIRKATSEDAPALTQMRWDDSAENGADMAQRFAEFSADFEQFVADAISGEEWTIWIAEDGDRIVSVAFTQLVRMVPRPGRFDSKWGYIAGVYTVPAERNKGIGAQLLNSLIEWAKAEGFESLVLWSGDRSAPLYQRAGFATVPEIYELDLDA